MVHSTTVTLCYRCSSVSQTRCTALGECLPQVNGSQPLMGRSGESEYTLVYSSPGSGTGLEVANCVASSTSFSASSSMAWEERTGGGVLVWLTRPNFSLQVIDPTSLPPNGQLGLAGQTSKVHERGREERVSARTEGLTVQKESYMWRFFSNHTERGSGDPMRSIARLEVTQVNKYVCRINLGMCHC